MARVDAIAVVPAALSTMVVHNEAGEVTVAVVTVAEARNLDGRPLAKAADRAVVVVCLPILLTSITLNTD